MDKNSGEEEKTVRCSTAVSRGLVAETQTWWASGDGEEERVWEREGSGGKERAGGEREEEVVVRKEHTWL